MATAIDAARFLIGLGMNQAESETGDGMTNMRVNKLLYFAQGYSLARFGKPLFTDPIEAWDRGPVVPSVYHRYKSFGKNILSDSLPGRDAISDEEQTLLMDVNDFMRSLSTYALVSKTHEADSPWRAVYGLPNNIISLESIRDYFLKHPFPESTSDRARKRVMALSVKPMRSQDGRPILPREWDDE